MLADGQLTARDILAESVGLDLLVLSGCETGVAESLGGHEFAGLSQAFVQAGVRCLVASLWAVEDPATEQLMTRSMSTGAPGPTWPGRSVRPRPAGRSWSPATGP